MSVRMRQGDGQVTRGTGGRIRPPQARLLPGLLVAAWVILAIVWIWSNPLGSAPDESDHYLRAVAAGHGNFVGTPAPNASFDRQGLIGGRKYFPIPAGLDIPPQFACDAFHENQPATCDEQPLTPSQKTLVRSSAGTYMPTAYIVPGVLMRLATDPATALRLGRVGSALLSLSLLAVAVRLLWPRDRSTFALLGMLMVVTPMQIFLLTEVGPNGLELAAATCYAAAVVRLARAAPMSSWHWAGLVYGGFILGTTRPLGPLWLLGGVIVALLFAGPSRIIGRIREQSLAAPIACAVVIVGVSLNLAWQAQYPGAGHVSIQSVLNTYWDGVNGVPQLLEQMVGWFGWLDTQLPSPLYLLWMVPVLTVAFLALLVGTWRQRLLIVVLGLAIVLLGGLMATFLSLALGYDGGTQGVQGRYLMPLVVWLPLICGEVVYVGRARLGQLEPKRLVLYVAGVTAFVQLSAWLVNSRRYAVGANGSILFLRFPLWEPPAGWWLWVVLVLAATALLTVVGVEPRRAGDHGPPRVARSSDVQGLGG